MGSGINGNVMEGANAFGIGRGVVDAAGGSLGFVITSVEKRYQFGNKQDTIVTQVDNVEL